MSVLEFRKELYEEMSHVYDIDSLKMLRDLAKLLRLKESVIQKDEEYVLTEEHSRSLDIGIAQSENPDDCIPHEKILEKYNAKYGSWEKK